jgi:hypothetical protein
MSKEDINEGYVHLPMTKNGDSRNVPLSTEAKRLLKLLSAESGSLLPVNVKHSNEHG